MKKIILLSLLMTGCSDQYDPDWQPGDEINKTTLPGRIHGDERSQEERYLDCLSGSKKESRSERLKCESRSRQPDKDYIGITLPLLRL